MKLRNSWLALFLISEGALALPQGFVYLEDIDPTIQQDMRYASAYNFIGRPIQGYNKGRCILTAQAARQLSLVQKALSAQGYSLKVYDCYRPTQAVADFYRWSQSPGGEKMKAEFYPREAKKRLFDRGYIAKSSGHSRGSTVDLTIVKTGQTRINKDPLTRCYSQTTRYLNDNSIDMGSRFDCLDISAYYAYPKASRQQKANRTLLRKWMMRYQFLPYDKEWWHFTLKDEPYPNRYFNFPVQ